MSFVVYRISYPLRGHEHVYTYIDLGLLREEPPVEGVKQEGTAYMQMNVGI